MLIMQHITLANLSYRKIIILDHATTMLIFFIDLLISIKLFFLQNLDIKG